MAAGAVALHKIGLVGRGNRGSVEVPKSAEAESKVALEFGGTERVQGMGVQMIRLNTGSRQTEYSYKSGHHDTRNLLFVSDSEPGGRWLFKDHKGLIVTVAQLREHTAPQDDVMPTKALYVEYIVQDTNGDGKLSSEDHASVGFARPDGNGFLPILSGVQRVLSRDLVNSAGIVVVYQRDNSIRRANIALDGFKLLSDVDIAKVPSTLQP